MRPSVQFFKTRARGRKKPGEMNKTELAYSQQLELLKRAGEIEDWWYERLTFKLADDTRYTPDFLVLTKSGYLECHEIKGHWEDDALVKIKVAAEQFPHRFLALTAVPKKQGGGWKIRDFSKWEDAA